VTINRKKEPIYSKAEIDRRCVAFEDTCRSRGVRVTPQRLAVYRALAEDPGHPTAEALYARLRERMPALSQATVYRTLEFLESENLIRRVSATEAIGRFDANLEPHQHLVCRVCGDLSDVSLPELARPALPVISGFTVEELDIRLVGRCRNCSRSKSLKRARSAGRRTKTKSIINPKS